MIRFYMQLQPQWTMRKQNDAIQVILTLNIVLNQLGFRQVTPTSMVKLLAKRSV